MTAYGRDYFDKAPDEDDTPDATLEVIEEEIFVEEQVRYPDTPRIIRQKMNYDQSYIEMFKNESKNTRICNDMRKRFKLPEINWIELMWWIATRSWDD